MDKGSKKAEPLSASIMHCGYNRNDRADDGSDDEELGVIEINIDAHGSAAVLAVD